MCVCVCMRILSMCASQGATGVTGSVGAQGVTGSPVRIVDSHIYIYKCILDTCMYQTSCLCSRGMWDLPALPAPKDRRYDDSKATHAHAHAHTHTHT